VAVAQALKQTRLAGDITVVATGIWTALELLDAPHINVVLAGGMIRGATGSMAGALATTILESFNFNSVFLGAAGLTADEGLTDTHLAEVELKRAIIRRAQRVVAVLDGSKFGRVGLASFAALERISHVVTDDTAPPDLVAALRERGLTVLIAGR
jgi:DeoR/GlpR family transcriptional regulator of sugar metabolism